MKICIEIPGSVSDGMWSPERGESRWAQNVAVALAKAGHQIFALGSGPPMWGSCPPIANIFFVNIQRSLLTTNTFLNDGSLDLYIDSCWYKGKPLPEIVKAKAYWHVHFGFEQHLKDPNWIKDNHYIVFPYQQTAHMFLNDQNPFKDRTFNIPIPLFYKRPLSSNFNQKGLVWSGKDTFLDRFLTQERVLVNSSIMLDALIIINQKYPTIPIHFLMAHQLHENYREAKEALKKYDVVNRINKITNFKKYNILNYNEVLNILKTSQVVTPPHWCGSHLEAVANGTVPLIREGFIFDGAAKNLGMLLPGYSTDTQELVDQIELLMFDEILYNKCLNAYQEEIKHHSEENVIQIVSKFQKDYL